MIFSDAYEPKGDELGVNTWFGVPTMPVVVDGVTYRVIFDTGAPTSYLSAGLVSEFEYVDTRMDFFPLKGSFENDIYSVPIVIAGKAMSFEMAAMKGTLASMLEPSGMPGIIGTGLLSHADVTLSTASKTMAVNWHEVI